MLIIWGSPVWMTGKCGRRGQGDMVTLYSKKAKA